jgi:hypothetical protein
MRDPRNCLGTGTRRLIRVGEGVARGPHEYDVQQRRPVRVVVSGTGDPEALVITATGTG